MSLLNLEEVILAKHPPCPISSPISLFIPSKWFLFADHLYVPENQFFSYWLSPLRLLECPTLTFLFRTQLPTPFLLKRTRIKTLSISFLRFLILTWSSQPTLNWLQVKHNIKTVSPVMDHLFELNPVWIIYLSTILSQGCCLCSETVLSVILLLFFLQCIYFSPSCDSGSFSHPGLLECTFFSLELLSLFRLMAVAYPLTSLSPPSCFPYIGTLTHYYRTTYLRPFHSI